MRTAARFGRVATTTGLLHRETLRRRGMWFILLASLIALPFGLHAADKVPLKMPNGKIARCDIVSVSIAKSEVVLKADGGKEQTLPLGVLTPQEVFACYQQVDKKDANLRFDMGNYLMTKKMFTEATVEFREVVKADHALKAKAQAFIDEIAVKQDGAKVATASKAPPPPEEKPKEIKKAGKEPKEEESGSSNTPGVDFAAMMSRREVPARSPQEMKEFLETRKKELDANIGGTWRMIETRHFYCFANITEAKHRIFADNNELFYNHLCMVLNHKEGDKLWNNKCPIYYFASYSQFQEFAVQIDRSPGAANSGGYFSAQGREVHICIPFMTGRVGNEKSADELAWNTLKHEGTHAFLQLTGEDVTLPRWLHEGLAQFIEFWPIKDTEKNNAERNQRSQFLAQRVRGGDMFTWDEMKDRPAGGTDIIGYSFAWSKIEFLYRAPFNGSVDNQRLPRFIRTLKSGKTEAEAMSGAFGMPVDKMEQWYQMWMKDNAKKNFSFK